MVRPNVFIIKGNLGRGGLCDWVMTLGDILGKVGGGAPHSKPQ